MKFFKSLIIFLFFFNFNNVTFAKDPSALINEIVDEAALILSSDDPVESKIIKLNAIAERSVDINGIGMYTLGYARVYKALRAELFYQKMIVTENYNFKNLLELRESIIDELEEARLLYNKTVLNNL